MTRPLLVSVAHGLDLVTFMAVLLAGVHISGEYNHLMVAAYAAGGLALVMLLKVAGAVALSCFVSWQRFPWFSRVALVPAVGMGLLGALVNAIAYAYN